MLKRFLANLRKATYDSVSAAWIAMPTGRVTAQKDVRVLYRGMKPCLMRLDENLHLPQIRQAQASLILSVLERLGVHHWDIPSGNNRPTRVAILAADRDRVIGELSRSPALAHWYLQVLGPSGHARPGFRLVGSAHRLRCPAGLRLFELVTSGDESSFHSDYRQGIELHFWSEDGNGSVISGIWNERVTLAPSPVLRPTDFQVTMRRWSVLPMDSVPFPIDVVYTWVDGSDEDWLLRKREFLRQEDDPKFRAEGDSEARFADHDELRFSLRSIDQYAPWVRKVWIVTAGQRPPWLDENNPRVEVVDHKDIWAGNGGLPSFNSHAIEASLHRIPDLAEHFLYFNDDFMFARPVRPESFFFANGVTKFFHSRALVDFDDVSSGDNASTVAAKNARRILQASFDVSFSRKFFHAPSPLRRSVLEAAESEYGSQFSLTRAAHFRQPSDIAAAGSFYFNYSFMKGLSVPGKIRYDYIDPATRDGRSRLRAVIKHHNMDAIVINDGSTLETEDERRITDHFIREELQRFLPVPSSFERTDGPSHDVPRERRLWSYRR